MNKKMHQDDQTRDENRRFDQQRVEEKHRSQAGKVWQHSDKQQGGFRREGREQAENEPGRQQGGWSDEEMRHAGRTPGMDRDRDYDPDGDRGGSMERE